MQDALQDLQNEFGEIAASFAVSSGAEFPPCSAIKQLGEVVGLAAQHAAQCPTQVLQHVNQACLMCRQRLRHLSKLPQTIFSSSFVASMQAGSKNAQRILAAIIAIHVHADDDKDKQVIRLQ